MTTDSNVHIVIRNYVDSGTLSGGSWDTFSPLTNIKTQDVKNVARTFPGLSTANTQFRVATENLAKAPWKVFTILGHNITVAGKWRVVLTDDPSDAPANRIFDSGLMNVWAPTATFGQLPWGVFPWNGIDLSAYPSAPMAIFLADASYYAKYAFFYIEDTTNPAGYVEIGRVIAGEAWRPDVNANYGLSIQWVDPSVSRRTRGGLKITKILPRYRVAELEFSFLSTTEAWGAVNEWMRLGKNHDVLYITNPQDDPSILFKRAFYGSLVDTSPIVENNFDTIGVRLQIEELV